ncbi:MAG: hypothetical protein KC609_06540, partial [Myxococcales bacterium]|nr:hypothetical protein [Myxococcales bacterium]
MTLRYNSATPRGLVASSFHLTQPQRQPLSPLPKKLACIFRGSRISILRFVREDTARFVDTFVHFDPALIDRFELAIQARWLADDLRKVVALIRANIDLFRAFINISEPQLERVSRLGDQLIRQIEATQASARAELQDTRYRAFCYFASLSAEIVTMGG